MTEREMERHTIPFQPPLPVIQPNRKPGKPGRKKRSAIKPLGDQPAATKSSEVTKIISSVQRERSYQRWLDRVSEREQEKGIETIRHTLFEKEIEEASLLQDQLAENAYREWLQRAKFHTYEKRAVPAWVNILEESPSAKKK